MQIITFDYETKRGIDSIAGAIRLNAEALRIQNKIKILKELYETKAIDIETYTESLNQIYKNT